MTSTSPSSSTSTRNGILFSALGGVLLVILYCCWRRIRYQQKRRKGQYQIAREISDDDEEAENWRVSDIPPGPSWSHVMEGLTAEQADTLSTNVTKLCARWVRQYGKIFQIFPSSSSSSSSLSFSSSSASSTSPWACFSGDELSSSHSIVVIADATCTKRLLCENENVGKSRRWAELLANSFGSSILTDVKKKEWHASAVRQGLAEFLSVKGKREDKIHEPFLSFMAETAKRMCSKMVSEIQHHQQQQQQTGGAGEWQQVRLLPYVEEYTLHALWFMLFGSDCPLTGEEDVRRIRENARVLLRRVCHGLSSSPQQWWQPLVPCTAAWRREREKRDYWRFLDTMICAQIKTLLAQGRATTPANQSVVAQILQLESRFAATSAGLNALVEEMRVLFLLGHETTHAALAFALGIVGERSDLRQEIAKQAAPKEGKNATERSPMACHVVLESLRLYPIVPVLVAQVLDHGGGGGGGGVLLETDDPTVQYKAPPGTLLVFPSRVMQCDPQYYCSVGIPHSFPTSADPNRWFSYGQRDEEHGATKTDRSTQHPTPFLAALGLGAHACPASSLILAQGEVLLTVLAQRFEWAAKLPPNGNNVNAAAAATSQKSAVLESHLRFEETLLLRPQNGLQVWVREKKE